MKGYTQKQKLEQFPRVLAERDRLDLAWSSWFLEQSPGCEYRAGIIRADSYPLLVLVFRCKGQSDSITVHALEPYMEYLRQSRTHSDCVQPILDAIADAWKNTQRKVAP